MSRRIKSCPNNKRIQGECNGQGDSDTATCEDCPVKQCKVGEYFSATCTCSPCKIRPADCGNMSWPGYDPRRTSYAGCEGTGVKDTGGCSSTDFNCGDACVEGQTYESTSCYPASRTPRQCSPCSHLSVDHLIGSTHFLQQPCTMFQNSIARLCKTFNESNCNRGTEYWSKCTEISDSLCIPCTNKICRAGWYTSQCYPDRDTECLPCTSSLECPKPETYRSECEGTSDHACKNCTQCKLGTSYERQPCTWNSDRECAPCTNQGACPRNHYKRSACTLTQDTVCYPCSSSLGYSCPAGYYESAPCNATSDRICSPCKTECPPGQYLAGTCSTSSNTQCVPCSSPSCGPGMYKTECSGRNDSKCAACDFPGGCGPGKFENQSCTPLTNRQCKECFQCTGNNYEVAKCTNNTDTRCGYCVQGSSTALAQWISNTYVTVVGNAWGLLRVGFPGSPDFCPAYSFGAGTCGSGYYESKRCSAPPALPDPKYAGSSRIPAGTNLLNPPVDTLQLTCSDNQRWLYHPNRIHECSPCRQACNPYRQDISCL